MSLYADLNADAKAWWYHKDLRKAGNHKEARKRERNSILSSVQHLRSVKLMVIGRGGWTLHLGPHDTVSGYGNGFPYVDYCKCKGIPVINSLSVPEDKIYSVAFRAPLFAIGRAPDPEPWNGLSYAPISYVAKLYKDAGAEVWNIPTE